MKRNTIYYCLDNETFYTREDIIEFYADYITEEAEANHMSISAIRKEVSLCDYIEEACGKNGSLEAIPVNEYESMRIASMLCRYIKASEEHIAEMFNNVDDIIESYISVLNDIYDCDIDADIDYREIYLIGRYWTACKMLKNS